MRILVADDHELLRRGLRGILEEAFPGVTIEESCDAASTLAAAERGPWEVILLDIRMPGRSGLEVLEDLKRLHSRIPVVILSAYTEEDYAVRAFKLGAAGYVCKSGASSELLAAIRKVLGGGRYVTPQLAERLAATLAGEEPADPHRLLSNREFQVLCLIARGRTLKEIGVELALSEKTIGTYRARISQKMNLGTNVELTRYAVQRGLVE